MNKAGLLLIFGLTALCGAAARATPDATVVDDALEQRVQSLAAEVSRQSVPGVRVEVRVGRLDSRLRLAPCAQVQPYLPTGMRLWGPARIGLRCADPGVRWNVFLPVTVDVYGPALVATAALPAGTVLAEGDLKTESVNLSASRSKALTAPHDVVGRALNRPLASGATLREGDLRARQWFAAGDTVRVVAGGNGWRIHAEGQALNPGIEGRTVRVRTESGRVVSGEATGERLVEVPL